MHMLASGRLNFWRLGSWGGRENCFLGKEGRKEGGVFSDGRFFLLGNEDVCFFFFEEGTGEWTFFFEFVHLVTP